MQQGSGKKLRFAVGRTMLRGAAQSAAASALAGIGWRLGVDLYDAIKRRLRRPGAPTRADIEPPAPADLEEPIE